jgi:hypothetical protein
VLSVSVFKGQKVQAAFCQLIEELDGGLSNAADEIRDIIDLHAKRHGTGMIM